jgi:hypothetical protein
VKIQNPKAHMFERDWSKSSNLLTIPHPIINTIEKTYAFNQKINKHALPINITI